MRICRSQYDAWNIPVKRSCCGAFNEPSCMKFHRKLTSARSHTCELPLHSVLDRPPFVAVVLLEIDNNRVVGVLC